MRHAHGLRKLNRTSSHRKALLSNLCKAFINHRTIKTTLPKAKELRPVMERLITRAKVNTVSNQRHAFKFLRDRDLVKKLFDELALNCLTRPGGYLRIIKNGFRQGDNAPMAIVQLVDIIPVDDSTK